jgi:hypothetical protein
MRHLFFLALLMTTHLYAQLDTGTGADGACTHLTINNDRIYNCTTLTLAGAPAFTFTNPVLLKVQGAVTISSALNLNGQTGASGINVIAVTPGGVGGPGAEDGGGISSGGSEDNGADASATGAAGNSGSPGIACAGGGGGGGFTVAGATGATCMAWTGGTGGLAAFAAAIPTPFRGGLGGGAGGDASDSLIGLGGGGGGAVHIIAGGDVLINANITAQGGNGGDSTDNGGGGGAGSGGVIWIQSVGQITNNAILNADGGTGGSSVNTGTGGAGGRGAVRLEDFDGVITGSGSTPAYTTTAATATSGPSASSPSITALNSSISCAVVQPKDHTLALQVMMGLGLMMILKFFTKAYRKTKRRLFT